MAPNPIPQIVVFDRAVPKSVKFTNLAGPTAAGTPATARGRRALPAADLTRPYQRGWANKGVRSQSRINIKIGEVEAMDGTN